VGRQDHIAARSSASLIPLPSSHPLALYEIWTHHQLSARNGKESPALSCQQKDIAVENTQQRPMATNVRHTYQSTRKDTLPRKSDMRRPRLLRAAATEPSISRSQASCGAVTSPTQSTWRATELLSRVAVVCGSPPQTSSQFSSPDSARSCMVDEKRGSSPPLDQTFEEFDPYTLHTGQ
jgi:hypothetical protein